MPNINVGESTKLALDARKLHPRETYDQVIVRLLEPKVNK
jgi:hypothetical protein